MYNLIVNIIQYNMGGIFMKHFKKIISAILVLSMMLSVLTVVATA